jgi:hypothetical protein
MPNELVAIVQQRTGLSEEISIDVVKAVIEFVKAKLPEPLAAHVDALVGPLDGSAPPSGEAAGAAGMLDMLGGLFGKK